MLEPDHHAKPDPQATKHETADHHFYDLMVVGSSPNSGAPEIYAREVGVDGTVSGVELSV